MAAVLFLSVCFSTNSAFAATTKNLDFGKWSFVSIPADPGAAGTVAAVFGDDLPSADYGSKWVVYAFDSVAFEYRLLSLNELLEPNKGYWIFQRVGNPVEIDVPESLAPLTGTEQTGCLAGQRCVSVPLTSSTSASLWNAVGYSSDSEALFGDTRFVTASGVCAQGCTPAEAQAANVAQSNMFLLNSEGTAYEVITENTPMQPWDGYWLLVLPDADQLRWVVPVGTSTPITPPADNQPPVAANDTRGPLDAGGSITLGVTANDTDADGSIVSSTVKIVQPPAFGNATVTADGLITYSHSGATGTDTDTFTYTVEDNDGAVSNIASVTISPIIDPDPETEPGPEPAIALNNDSVIGLLGGQPVNGNVATNDTIPTDAAQRGLAFAVTGQPSNGRASINGVTGEFEYLPDTGFSGNDAFTYSLVQFDENQSPVSIVASARVNVRIDGLVLVEDSLSALSGVQSSRNVLANDSLPNNAIERGLRVQVIQQPANGFVDMDPINGAYSYVSNQGYSGSDDFVYGVVQVDQNEQLVAVLAQSTVSVDVQPIEVVDDQFTGVSGQAVYGVVSNNDTLPQAAAALGLRLRVTTQPENGSVEMNPVTGEFSYTSLDSFFGKDTFSYALVQVDQQGTQVGVVSDNAQVQIDVSAPVTFYLDFDYQNTSWSATVGSYDSLLGTPVSINTISSFRVAPGFAVRACIATLFRGRCKDYQSDSKELGPLYNNQIDSVEIIQLQADISSSPNGQLNDYTVSGLAGLGTGDTVMPDLELQSDQGYAITRQPTRGAVLMSPTGRYLYSPATKYAGTDTFDYALVRFNQFGAVAERLAEATITVDYSGFLVLESEDSRFDNAIGTYELDADGNPTNMRGIFLRTVLSDDGDVMGLYKEVPRLFLIVNAGGRASVDDVITWNGGTSILVNGGAIPLNIVWDDARFNSSGLNLVNYETTDDGEVLVGFEDVITGGDGDFTDVVLRLKVDTTADD